MRKILLILTALVMSVAVFAQKITTPGGITSGNKYYVGATTNSTDYYFYVDGSSATASIKGVAKEDVADAVALTFTEVTGGWTIQFENGLYLGIKNAKDNGAVQVVEDAVVWTIDEDEDNGLLKLHPNDYYLQKNNGGTQFGSYKNQQTNVWLESAGGATPVSAILESIVIKGAATKMAYEVGEAFDPAGLEVWGLYTKYVKNDSTSQITSGITWSIDPETFTTVSGNASVTLSASYKDKTSSDTTITGINVSNPPFVENFDNMADFADGYYVKNATINTTASYSYGNAGKSVKLTTTATDGAYIIFPLMNIAANNIEVDFMMRRAAAATATIKAIPFQVGYLTDPTDVTTFIPAIQDVIDGDASWRNIRLNTARIQDVTTPVMVCINIGAAYATSVYLDEVSIHVMPSCTRPEHLTASAVKADHVTLTWDMANASSFVVKALQLPDSVVTTYPATQSPFTVTGLIPQTTYEFTVQGVCSATDSSEVTRPISVRTECAAADSPIFFEGAEGTTGTAIPECWKTDYIVNMSTSTAAPFQTSSQTKIGTRSFSIPYKASGTISYLCSQPLHFDQSGKYSFRYQMYRPSGTTYNGETLTIYVTPSVGDTANAVEVIPAINFSAGNAPVTTTIGWNEYEGVINYQGDGYIMAVINCKNGMLRYIDNLEVFLTPSCPKPNEVAITNITTHSFDISFVDNASASQWVVYTNGTPNVITTNPATISNLDASMNYTVSIAAVCSATDTSAVTDCGTIRTLCNKLSTPWVCGFEASEGYVGGTSYNAETTADFNVGCWTIFNQKPGGATYPYAYVSTSSNCVHSGAQGVYTYTSSSATKNLYMMLPDLSDPSNKLRINVWYKNGGTTTAYSDLEFGYFTDPTADTSFVTVYTFPKSSTWIKGEILTNNASYNIPANARIGFMIDRNSTGNGLYLDDISVNLIRNCSDPDAPTVSDITAASAKVTFTDTCATHTAWEYVYGPVGFDPNTATPVSIDTTAFTLTGLTDDSNYNVYVRAVCGVGDVSNYVPVSFKTKCLPFHVTATTPFFEDFNNYNYGAYLNNGTCYTILGEDLSASNNYWAKAYPASEPSATATTFYFYGHSADRYDRSLYWYLHKTYITNGTFLRQFHLDAGTTYEMSAWARNSTTTTYSTLLSAMMGTTANDLDTLASLVLDGANTTSRVIEGHNTYSYNELYQEIKAFITPDSTGDYYIGFNAAINNTQTYSYLYFDDWSIRAVGAPAHPGLEQIIADSVAGKAAGATVTIDLNAGEEYPLNGLADAGLVNIVINGHGAKVILADSTQIAGQQRIEINNVNFDCAANTKLAPIALSANPDSVLVGSRFQTEGTALRQNAFYDTCAIVINGCNFSDVKTPLVSANKREWNLKGLIIRNVVAQFNVASGIDSYICWYGNSKNEGSIKEIVIEGSTLYNIVENNSNYFIRYANNSNSQPQKAWPEPQFDGKCSWTMTNNTIVNLPSNKDFANNYPNKNPICEFTWKGNIFYNTTLLRKAIQSNVANFSAADNAIIGITKAVDATDNQKYATIDSLLIQGGNRMTTPTTALDFTKIDSLVNNFAPATTSYAGSHGFGDPRWVSMSTITANVNDTAMGSVTGAGEYAIGAEVTLTATAKEGYRFSNWTNANTGDTLSTENPWTITVTQDSTIVANFVINNLFTITLNVNDEAMGSVEGAGIYTRGDVAVVTAIPAEHHHFVHWNNGSLDPTTNVFVIMDTTLTATFAIDQHIVTAKSSNNALGSVAGAGTYNYGEEVTLTATPAAHAVFTGWSNGLTDDTITITLAGDTTVTAMFAADTHTIAATADPTMGSVTGAGEYVHGTLATLTATANEHYHFVNWSNGLTVNTFSILVDKDSTVTANFAIDQHVVTANVNNNALGTVAGAGTYNYGATATLTATPAAHAVFTGWSNGLTDDTITITVAGDTTVTAMFAADTHTIAATADPTMGSVTGAGEYVHGTLATLTATANEHYHFVNWSNGLTANTFSILVDKDSTVTANFAIDQHVVTANASDNALGTVVGAGTYNYGASVTLTATPSAHGVFAGWSDGTTANPYTFTLAGDTTVTANFSYDTHTIAANVNSTTMGSVRGAGTYAHGTLVTLEAVANAHYHFVNWSNGLTANTFSILVENDSTVTANFAIDQHVVTANASDNALGTVAGAGTYNYGASVTLTATPSAHGVFTRWSDGTTANPYTFTLAGDTTVTANFSYDTHTIAANVNSTTMGSVRGAGTYAHGTLVTLEAVANAHYHFVNWSNGLTANTFSILVENDSTVTANFAIDQHVVTVNANDNALGTVAGAGTYNYGAQVTLTATAAAHGVFTGWSNGLTDATINITVAGDTTVTAMFAADTHTIAATADPTMGSVTGAGTYTHGALATLTATPNEHFHFVNWSNGLTANTFSILVDRDSTVTANFAVDQHNVSAIVNDQTMGSVTGTGMYNYGSNATLTAVPAAHYHFVRWNTGKTNVNQTVNVTGDITFIATFAIDQHNATILSSDESLGIVSGSGLYNYGSQVAINAIPNHRGVSFTGWSNGLTTPTAVIDLTKDTVITASFVLNHYDIILNVNDETMGSVAGAGTYIYGDEVTITATAADDCHSFVRWSDGETAATRTITVDDNVTLTAIFAIDQYTISVASSDNAGGKAYCDKSGAEVSSMTVACGTMVDIYAEANQYYHFVEWSDGVTDDMRSIEVNGDINLVAIFAPNCGDNADLPVVFLYNGLVMLDLDSVKERGYDPKPSQVKWYQVVGDVDNIEASFPADDQYVCEGYYLSLPTNNVGYGQYYAVVDVSNSPAALCHDKMKTVVVEYTNTNSQQNVQMAPTRVKSGEVITITGLVPDEKTTITVYDYTGKSVDVMQTEGLAIYDFTSYGVTGVYIVKVTSDSVNETFKFIVSK